MGDLTPHFSSREFHCRDGSTHLIDCRLLAMLEAIRCCFGPTTITSGYRSPEYNAAVGGAPDSFHLRGMAADIQVANTTPDVVHAWADEHFPVSGLGLYLSDQGGWVHIDCRPSRARWTG